MDVTFNQLRVFRAVIDHGGFSRAAEAIRVSQPAVSKAVKDLERQAGQRLFEQVGRKVQLTAAGHLLDGHAARILGELAAAERGLAAIGRGEGGRLAVGASNLPGIYLLPE